MTADAQKAKYAIVILMVCAAALPTLFKPPHIDEESYLFIAQSIADHPHLPYHWWRAWQPFTEAASTSYIYAHPPLFSWILIVVGKITQWQPIWLLRLSLLPFVGLLFFAIHRLAALFTRNAAQNTLWILSAPALLVLCHQTLMIDLPTLALSLSGLALLWPYLRGGQRRHLKAAIVGSVALGLATLTKYPTLIYLPFCLAIAWNGRRNGRRRALLPLCISGGIFLAWQGYSAWIYGSPHLYFVLSQAHQIARSSIASRALGLSSHMGLTMLSPLLLIPLLYRRPPLPKIAMAAGLSVLFMGLSTTGLWDEIVPNRPQDFLGLGILGWGIFLSVFSLLVLGKSLIQDRENRLLTLWIALVFGAVLLGHNFTSARYLAPASIPLTLLILRHLEGQKAAEETQDTTSFDLPFSQFGMACIALAFACLIAWGDLSWARNIHLQDQVVQGWIEKNAGDKPVYFAGEWTFRFDAEAAGWKNLRLYDGEAAYLVVASMSAPEKLPENRKLRQSWPVQAFPLRTHDPEAGIGFYSEIFGLLPYGLSQSDIEVIEVYTLGDQ